MSLFHVEKKTFPAMQVAALRRVIPCYEQEGELWKEMRQALRQLGAEGQMSEKKGLMTVYYDEGFCEREVDVEIRSVVSGSFSDCQNVQFKTIPSITAATAMLNGRHDQVGQVYAEIARWVEQNGCRIKGPMFNIYYVSPAMDPNPDHWVTEVCVPLAE